MAGSEASVGEVRRGLEGEGRDGKVKGYEELWEWGTAHYFFTVPALFSLSRPPQNY